MRPIGRHIRVILLLALLLLPEPAQAHGGPPIPVLYDEQLGPYTTTVWADPDVGTALFIIDVSLAPTPQPVDTSVYLQVQRLDGAPARSDGVTYTASKHSRIDEGLERLTVLLPFEAEGYWQVDLTLDSAAGVATTQFSLEATPPGARWLELFLTFIPFGIIIIFLWLRLRKAQSMPDGLEDTSPSASNEFGT
jgi:hypothetical protein